LLEDGKVNLFRHALHSMTVSSYDAGITT
jgi:hypothetical protein